MTERLVPALLLVIAMIVAMPLLATALQTGISAVPSAADITLTIDFSNGTISTFSGLDGTTVLNVTRSVVEMEVNWAGDLAYVVSLGGVGQDSSHWWQYWVNGEYASVAANLYILQDGDDIIWNLTTFETQGTTTGFDSSLLAGGVLLGVGGLGFLLVLDAKISRRQGTT